MNSNKNISFSKALLTFTFSVPGAAFMKSALFIGNIASKKILRTNINQKNWMSTAFASHESKEGRQEETTLTRPFELSYQKGESILTLKGESTLQQGHPYHLVDSSPWPLQTSIVLGTFVASFVLTFAQVQGASILFWCSLISLVTHMSLWFSDIVSEGSLNGDHTTIVMRGLVLGMSLFIMTEVIFFLFIFWTYLHSSLSPTVELGCDWPPLGIDPLDAKAIPTLNTALLLSSGAAVTWSHHALLGGDRKGAILGLILTIILAVIFTMLQGFEYVTASFTMADSTYGNTFFLGTGAHGLHVIMGTIILAVAGIRLITYHFTNSHHIGYEAGILYWHFVDIVWLILYVIFYWWGS